MGEGEGGGEDNAVRFKNKRCLQGKDEGQSCVWVSKKNRDELLNLTAPGHLMPNWVQEFLPNADLALVGGTANPQTSYMFFKPAT
jgi:hypothetical protein